MKPFDYIVVGAGLFSALRMKQRHAVISKSDWRNHIAGIFAQRSGHSRGYEYGAHIFHERQEDLGLHVHQFATFNPLYQYSSCQLQRKSTTPFNMNTQ